MQICAFKKLPENIPSWLEQEIIDVDRTMPPVLDTDFYEHDDLAQRVNDALVSAKMAVEHYDHLLRIYKQTVEFDKNRITDICQAYSYIAKEKHIEFNDVKKYLDEQEKSDEIGNN
jgi:hypothetical protein